MQRAFFTLVPMILLAVTGCAGTMYQQTPPVSTPSASEIQGRCFANFKKFNEQTECIENAFNASGLATNPYAQEYLSYMQMLREKVVRKGLSENNARAELAKKHNELRSLQQNEVAAQEQRDNQRTMQSYEMLNRNNYQLQMPQVRARPIPSPVQTNCQAAGNQVNCTSQ